jgi:hypothetical protein
MTLEELIQQLKKEFDFVYIRERTIYFAFRTRTGSKTYITRSSLLDVVHSVNAAAREICLTSVRTSLRSNMTYPTLY